jgi:ribonuclease VapC
MKSPALARSAAQAHDRHVLDSSALMAALLVEPGGDVVADVLTNAVMSAVNTAEVVSKLVDKGMPLSKAVKAVHIFRLHIEPLDTHQAIAIAALRAPTVKFGLSLGDRACLALAQQLKLPVMTADKIWANLDIGVEIKVVR